MLKQKLILQLFNTTCGNGKNHTAPPSRKSAPHPFKTCHIELFDIELFDIKLLLRVLSLLKTWQNSPNLGAIAGDNMRSRLRYGHAKCSYRNHRIKYVIYNRFSVFEGWFYYPPKRGDNVLIIIKTYTKAIFNMVSGRHNIYKLRSESNVERN